MDELKLRNLLLDLWRTHRKQAIEFYFQDKSKFNLFLYERAAMQTIDEVVQNNVELFDLVWDEMVSERIEDGYSYIFNYDSSWDDKGNNEDYICEHGYDDSDKCPDCCH